MPSPQGRMTAGMMRKMAMLRKGAPKKSKAMPSVSKGTPKAMPGFRKSTPKSKAMPLRPIAPNKKSKAMPLRPIAPNKFKAMSEPERPSPIRKKRILKESPYMRGGR